MKKETKKPSTAAAKPAARPPRTRATSNDASTRPAATGELPRVRVRMYRQGLGDCFLLTFHAGRAGQERHVMIDCGTLGAKTTGVKLNEVVDNIVTTTGGQVDLLVLTHEHQDHVSGFRDSAKLFRDEDKDRWKVKFNRVWQAWTENPDDDLAREVAKYKDDLGTALLALVGAPGLDQVAPGVPDLLGFFGETLLGAGKFAAGVNETMEFVRTGLGSKASYLEPGKPPPDESWLPGFRIYVLGPPRSKEKLGIVGEHGSDELYHMAAAGRAATLALDRAVQAAATESLAGDDQGRPFDQRFWCAPEAASAQFPEYFSRENEWRTIDHEHLRFTSELALQLDSLTNNTSLALAFERIADGKVILFPADAQEGNWLSWHDLTFEVAPEGGGPARKVTATDLLARTVFYKVGHHGSHNATASRKGLELMTSQNELTAFIPVDRAVALGRNPKGSWKMPAVALYRQLLIKCQGRVARSDLGWAAKAAGAVEAAFDGLATNGEWQAWSATQNAATHVDCKNPLFVDYVLH